MQRDEVLHVCRAVTSQLGVVRLLALGSQAIHVILEPEDVPDQVVASVELDLVVLDTLPGTCNSRTHRGRDFDRPDRGRAAPRPNRGQPQQPPEPCPP